MNLDIDTMSSNAIDYYFPDIDTNFLLDFDNLNQNCKILNSPTDSLNINDNFYPSSFQLNSESKIRLDHEYCLATNDFHLSAPQIIEEITNQLQDHADVSFLDFGEVVDVMSSNLVSDSNIQFEYPSEYVANNLQNITSNEGNDYNILIGDNFAETLNTFDIDEEYESLSDEEGDFAKKIIQNTSKKKYTLPMTIHDLKPKYRTRFKQNCELVLSEEEKKILLEYNCDLPTNVPLTREEQRILKTVRRKIRNKYAAKMSRQKKQDYMEGLERRVKLCTTQNQQLQSEVRNLEYQNNMLMNQLKQLQNLINKSNPLSSQSMESMTKLVTNRHAQTGTCFMVLLLSFSLFILPNLTQLFGTNEPNSQPLFGNSRKILQLNSLSSLLSSNPNQLSANDNKASNYLNEYSTDQNTTLKYLNQESIKNNFNPQSFNLNSESDLRITNIQMNMGDKSSNQDYHGQVKADEKLDVEEVDYEAPLQQPEEPELQFITDSVTNTSAAISKKDL